MKRIKIGVFGAGRGMSLAENFMLMDTEVVAICDSHKERLASALKRLDKSVAVYERFEDFIEHPMDAVIIANNFHQHTPYVIACFERNLHVFAGHRIHGVILILRVGVFLGQQIQ